MTTSDGATRRPCDVCDRNDKPMICKSGTLIDQCVDLHRDLHEILNAGLRPLERLLARPWGPSAFVVAVAILLAAVAAFGGES